MFLTYQKKVSRPLKPGDKTWHDQVLGMKPHDELKLLGHIIDHIWHGIMVIDENREIVRINESLSSLFYLGKDDVLGKKTISVFNNTRFEAFIEYAFKSLEPHRESIIFYGDEELYLDMEIFPVTARGDLMDKKDKSSTAGIKMVILVKNNTQEVEFSKLRSQFVANVSHEMRTPLTAIRGYLEILEEEIVSDKKVKSYVAKGLKETVRLNDLIEDVLNLSKIEYKRNVLLKSKVELVTIIEEVIEGLKDLARQNEMEIVFDYTSQHISLMTDPDLFRQLVKNLAENAVFHAGRQSKLSISLGNTQEGIYVYFKDDGVGIAKGDLPFIFQRFYRGKAPFSAKRIGSGLGLSIVKHIVDLHNGRIKVSSKPHAETLFKVFLPAKQTLDQQ